MPLIVRRLDRDTQRAPSGASLCALRANMYFILPMYYQRHSMNRYVAYPMVFRDVLDRSTVPCILATSKHAPSRSVSPRGDFIGPCARMVYQLHRRT